MKIDHELKCWPEYFRPIETHAKAFDLRKNDRKPRFKVGDIIRFAEWDDRRGQYTGRAAVRRVTCIVDGIGSGAIPPLHGLQRGYCILGLTDLKEEEGI